MYIFMPFFNLDENNIINKLLKMSENIFAFQKIKSI